MESSGQDPLPRRIGLAVVTVIGAGLVSVLALEHTFEPPSRVLTPAPTLAVSPALAASASPLPSPSPERVASPTPQPTPDWKMSFPPRPRAEWNRPIFWTGQGFSDPPPEVYQREVAPWPKDLAWWQPSPERAYRKGIELFEAGRDGNPLLVRAARAGHLEAAFLSWIWDARIGAMEDLKKLLTKESPQQLLRSFGEKSSGLPGFLSPKLSYGHVRSEAERVLVELDSGERERVSRALEAFANQPPPAADLKLYLSERPADLTLSLVGIESFVVESQKLAVAQNCLVLKIRLRVKVTTRAVFTREGKSVDRQGTTTWTLSVQDYLPHLGTVR